jgi:hypothetical protein
MKKRTLFPSLAVTALCIATAAQAEMPLFAANCPVGGNVDADRTGTVRVGGNVASLREFNPNYYEATYDGVTYSISHDGGGQGLIVSFTASGGRNGNCTILSSGAAPGGGSSAGSGDTVRVQFAAGTTGAELTGELRPGESRRYLLGAANGQNFYFRLAANGPGMTYVIYNPDGSVLLDEMRAAQEYRGQLWQSGDHIVTVYNTSNGVQSYNVIFGID